MAETYNKKEREKKRLQKRKEKQSKKEARKDDNKGGWESMMAYVDENGVIHDKPIDPKDKTEVEAEDIEIGVPKKEKEEFDPILEGVINYYDSSKGYGFIKTRDDESFFVHRNNISGEPSQGNRVSFEKEKGQRGWVAVRVTIQ